MKIRLLILFVMTCGFVMAQPKLSTKKIEALKKEASDKVAADAKRVQVMVDKIFSFAELGFGRVSVINTSFFLPSFRAYPQQRIL